MIVIGYIYYSNIIIISFVSDGVFSFMETFEKQSLDVMTKLYDSSLEQNELEERQRDVSKDIEIYSIIVWYLSLDQQKSLRLEA